MDLSIIILSYNTQRLLDDCLRSVQASIAESGAAVEVLLVDSGSTDGSIALVRERYPWVDLTVTEGFGGFAHANNLALRRAGGRYRLLLNSDTVLPPDGLRKVLAFMDSRPDIGLLGVKLVKGDGTLDRACRRSFPTPEVSFYRLSGLTSLFPRSRRFGRYNLTYLDPDQATEVDSVCGAFAWVRQEAIAQAGLLDEDFYFYGEDLDWAYRIKEQGWVVYYYPAVQVLHYKGQSSRQQSARMIHEFYRAMRLFYDKHYKAQYPRALRTLIFAGIGLGERWAQLKNRLRPAQEKRVST